jgi:hypothetical protein
MHISEQPLASEQVSKRVTVVEFVDASPELIVMEPVGGNDVGKA